MKIIKTMLLSLRIKFHRCLIKYYQRQFDVLHDAGESLTSERVQTLNQRASKHVAAVMRCERQQKKIWKK